MLTNSLKHMHGDEYKYKYKKGWIQPYILSDLSLNMILDEFREKNYESKIMLCVLCDIYLCQSQ